MFITEDSKYKTGRKEKNTWFMTFQTFKFSSSSVWTMWLEGFFHISAMKKELSEIMEKITFVSLLYKLEAKLLSMLRQWAI